MDKKRIFIFLIIILALAAFFRLWQINDYPPGLYHDEAMNGNNALEAMESGDYKWFYSENNGREGLYINLLAIPLSIFGNEPWALRSLSAVFGILTVLGLYLLTRELFKNERLALFASFFMAVSFWHILFSRIGFRAIMAPFFLVWAFCLLFKIINKKETIHYWLLAIGSGLLFGLGFHSYIAYRAAPLLLIIPFVILWRQKQKKIIVIFLLGTLIAGLPLGWYFLNNPADFFGRTSQISVFSSETPVKDLVINSAKTIGMLFVYGDANWRHNLSGSPQLWWPLAILFLLGIWNLKNTASSPKLFLLAWIIVMSLPVVISNEGIPHALRAIILIPPIMILAGLGLEFIVSKINGWHSKKQFIVLLFVFLLLVGSHSYIQYFLRWAPNAHTQGAFNIRYVQIGNYLNTLPVETEKYVAVNAGGVLARGIPMPAQSVMFITNTFTEKKQEEKNIHYILTENINEISCPNSCAIITLEIDAALREKIKQQIPDLNLDIESGVEILRK